ncbi:MAG: DNA methyltransferase [Candidatus Hodarchaeales archaeon]|jgi:DNA modification methylase
MNSLSNGQKDTANEIWDYFEFICRPHSLRKVFSLEDLLKNPENTAFGKFWEIIAQNNLNCFQVEIRIKKQDLIFYYLDLETPLVFIPVLTKSIDPQRFSLFLSATKTIRSHLGTIYNQEIEYLLINIANETEEDSFLVFKPEEQQRGITSMISLKYGRKKRPFGILSKKNKLNYLTGREWLRMTKSWIIVRPPPRNKNEILHPAKFPEILIRKFITFFTKPGELVVDPFLGSGSTVLAAKQCNRNAIGIELSERYIQISKERLAPLVALPYSSLYSTQEKGYWYIIHDNSMNLTDIWSKQGYSEIDLVITSPPYWSQLDRTEMRQKERKNKGLDTKYSDLDRLDLANIKDYNLFLETQKNIFTQIHGLMKPKGYLVVITNNVFTEGKLFPLAYDTATSISDTDWILKDEKIWLQDDKRLLALGVNNAWVGNRCHQYCLIFRKE